MSEEPLLLEDSRREILRLAGQTLKLLTSAGPSESPSRYQAAIRNASALAEMWAHHIRKLNAVFPLVISVDLHFAKSFDRMMDDNLAVERMLVRLASSAWPRSSQSGLTSIRALATESLILVLRQLDREETMLSVISRQQELVPMPGPNPSVPLDHLSA